MSDNRHKEPENVEHVTSLMTQEIIALNDQIHQYLRITTQVIAFTVAVLAAVISIQSNDEMWAVTASICAPLLLSIAFVYHANVANEVAALAEVRDRLCGKVNRLLGDDVMWLRAASDASLRGGKITNIITGQYVIVTLLVILLGEISVLRATSPYWIAWTLAWFLLSLLSVATSTYAFLQIPATRVKVNAELDRLYGDIDRPSKAADSGDSLREKLTIKKTDKR